MLKVTVANQCVVHVFVLFLIYTHRQHYIWHIKDNEDLGRDFEELSSPYTKWCSCFVKLVVVCFQKRQICNFSSAFPLLSVSYLLYSFPPFSHWRRNRGFSLQVCKWFIGFLLRRATPSLFHPNFGMFPLD